MKIERAFQNEIMNTRKLLTEQKILANHFSDMLIRQNEQSFDRLKTASATENWNQIAGYGVGLVVAFGVGVVTKTFQPELIQMSAKAADFYNNTFEGPALKKLTEQAAQQKIQHHLTLWNTVLSARTQEIQTLEGILQELKQATAPMNH